ncbi:hypothetical protein Y032_0096g2885 [Ancylostoma ceylanicum]|uniref:Uncharacterized protein n=1 Tax=Ancylostoma ceylanicum TaxID=53326 RepID=A0A016TJ52_9BILA|nr:hypothetical protein Y032_0096g2885 [Ancylostoma ceylanicum]
MSRFYILLTVLSALALGANAMFGGGFGHGGFGYGHGIVAAVPLYYGHGFHGFGHGFGHGWGGWGPWRNRKAAHKHKRTH